MEEASVGDVLGMAAFTAADGYLDRQQVDSSTGVLSSRATGPPLLLLCTVLLRDGGDFLSYAQRVSLDPADCSKCGSVLCATPHVEISFLILGSS